MKDNYLTYGGNWRAIRRNLTLGSALWKGMQRVKGNFFGSRISHYHWKWWKYLLWVVQWCL